MVPHGESAYYGLRPTISVPRPSPMGGQAGKSAIDLDGFFGLHPSLALAQRDAASSAILCHCDTFVLIIRFSLFVACSAATFGRRRPSHRLASCIWAAVRRN